MEKIDKIKIEDKNYININTNEKYQLWLRKRTIFHWVANVLILIYGISANISNLTFIFYIHDRFSISLQRVGFYYSISFTGNSLIQMVGSLILGRYVDRTGNIKLTIMFIILLSFICHLFYSFHPNIWVIVAANCLSGISEALQSAVLGN